MENKKINLSKSEIDDKIIRPIKKSINQASIYILVVLIAFISVGFFSLKKEISTIKDNVSVVETIDTVTINDTIKTIDTTIEDNTAVAECNSTKDDMLDIFQLFVIIIIILSCILVVMIMI